MAAIEHPDCEAVTIAIEQFRGFLNSAWPALTEVLNKHDWDNDAYFLEDWLDANCWSVVNSLARKAGFNPSQ